MNILLKLPFGKYRDRSVRQMVEADVNYAHWALSKPWFSRLYPEHANGVRRLLVQRLKAELEAEELA